jgi:hypothetical protein
MKEPKWEFFESKTKRINVIDIDPKLREIDALDMETSVPFVLDVPDSSLLKEIEKGENYMATFRVFKAKMTPGDEKGMSEVSDPETMKIIKEKGGKLFKFELISVEEA